MKSKLIIGSFLIFFLVLMMPSIPAVQYKIVTDENNKLIMEKIQNVDIDALEKKLKNMPDQKIQKALESIDFSDAKQKIREFLANEQTTPTLNGFGFYSISFLLTLIYQIVLGRPSIVMSYFMILSITIIVTSLLNGQQPHVCLFAQMGFIPWVVLNLIGLIAFKTLPNKIIGLAILILFYVLSEFVAAIAFTSEINATS
ncbi:MAG: hypothetical protein V1726_08845 [Methanobacteriota archaeon]